MVTAPASAGALASPWCGVSRGVSVGVAMGDLQCSIKAAEPTLTDVGEWTCVPCGWADLCAVWVSGPVCRVGGRTCVPCGWADLCDVWVN